MTPPKLKREVPRIALTRTEAAYALGVSPDFFDEHVRPFVRAVYLGGKPTLFWRVASLERFMAEREGVELHARR